MLLCSISKDFYNLEYYAADRNCREVPKVMPRYDWSSALLKFAELEVLAEKIGQIAETTAKDVRTQFAARSTYDESDSDSGSDSSSFMSVGNFEDIVEDLNVYCES